MLAYSSIAHAGFILTGLTAAGAVGIRAAVFYLVAYAAMTVGAFGTVMLVSGRGEERTRIADYAGLARTNPLSAALMTLFLLSLAGIPPTAGFIAKVNVFSAAIGAGYWGLVLLGVAHERRGGLLLPPRDRRDVHAGAGGGLDLGARREGAVVGRGAGAVLVVPAAATLVLGVFPGVIVGVIEKASVLRW